MTVLNGWGEEIKNWSELVLLYLISIILVSLLQRIRHYDCLQASAESEKSMSVLGPNQLKGGNLMMPAVLVKFLPQRPPLKRRKNTVCRIFFCCVLRKPNWIWKKNPPRFRVNSCLKVWFHLSVVLCRAEVRKEKKGALTRLCLFTQKLTY